MKYSFMKGHFFPSYPCGVITTVFGLTAWSLDYVFIWHTEQECGEGWLYAQRNPEILEEQITLSIW